MVLHGSYTQIMHALAESVLEEQFFRGAWNLKLFLDVAQCSRKNTDFEIRERFESNLPFTSCVTWYKLCNSFASYFPHLQNGNLPLRTKQKCPVSSCQVVSDSLQPYGL